MEYEVIVCTGYEKVSTVFVNIKIYAIQGKEIQGEETLILCQRTRKGCRYRKYPYTEYSYFTKFTQHNNVHCLFLSMVLRNVH